MGKGTTVMGTGTKQVGRVQNDGKRYKHFKSPAKFLLWGVGRHKIICHDELLLAT